MSNAHGGVYRYEGDRVGRHSTEHLGTDVPTTAIPAHRVTRPVLRPSLRARVWARLTRWFRIH